MWTGTGRCECSGDDSGSGRRCRRCRGSDRRIDRLGHQEADGAPSLSSDDDGHGTSCASESLVLLRVSTPGVQVKASASCESKTMVVSAVVRVSGSSSGSAMMVVRPVTTTVPVRASDGCRVGSTARRQAGDRGTVMVTAVVGVLTGERCVVGKGDGGWSAAVLPGPGT